MVFPDTSKFPPRVQTILTKDLCRTCNDARIQGNCNHDRLHNTARLVLIHGNVITECLIPLANIFRIKVRQRDHGQHGPGLRICHHGPSGLSLKLRHLLQHGLAHELLNRGINRENDALPLDVPHRLSNNILQQSNRTPLNVF